MQKRFMVAIAGAAVALVVIGGIMCYLNNVSNNSSSSDSSGKKPLAGFPLSWANEPAKHKQAREQIIAKSSSYHPNQVMEWYLVRVSPSGLPLDMVTCTYILLPPGKEVQGDIDAFVEIFNPDTTKWSNNATIHEMVVEYARFGFANQTIELRNGRTFVFPEVVGENIIQMGYLTFRVNV